MREDVFEQPQAAVPPWVGQIIVTRRQQRQVVIEKISDSDPPIGYVGRTIARPFVAPNRP